MLLLIVLDVLFQNMQKMIISQQPPPIVTVSGDSAPKPRQPTQPSSSSAFKSAAKPLPDTFGVQPKSGMTGAQAANNWLQSAMSEAQTSDTHRAVMVRCVQIHVA